MIVEGFDCTVLQLCGLAQKLEEVIVLAHKQRHCSRIGNSTLLYRRNHRTTDLKYSISILRHSVLAAIHLVTPTRTAK